MSDRTILELQKARLREHPQFNKVLEATWELIEGNAQNDAPSFLGVLKLVGDMASVLTPEYVGAALELCTESILQSYGERVREKMLDTQKQANDALAAALRGGKE